MGSYSELYVGKYPLFSLKGDVDPILMTVFIEADKYVYEQSISDRKALLGINDEDEEGEDEVITICEYRNSVTNVKQRLEVMGFTVDRAIREYEQAKIYEIEQLRTTLLHKRG